MLFQFVKNSLKASWDFLRKKLKLVSDCYLQIHFFINFNTILTFPDCLNLPRQTKLNNKFLNKKTLQIRKLMLKLYSKYIRNFISKQQYRPDYLTWFPAYSMISSQLKPSSRSNFHQQTKVPNLDHPHPNHAQTHNNCLMFFGSKIASADVPQIFMLYL